MQQVPILAVRADRQAGLVARLHVAVPLPHGPAIVAVAIPLRQPAARGRSEYQKLHVDPLRLNRSPASCGSSSGSCRLCPEYHRFPAVAAGSLRLAAGHGRSHFPPRPSPHRCGKCRWWPTHRRWRLCQESRFLCALDSAGAGSAGHVADRHGTERVRSPQIAKAPQDTYRELTRRSTASLRSSY